MRGRLGELRKAPWTLWAYVGLSLLAVVASAVLADSPVRWFLPIALAVQVLFAYFLLRGSRFMWWLLLVLTVGSIPFSFTANSWRWNIPLTLVELALLLAPPSRRFVFVPKPQAEEFTAPEDSGELGSQTSWNPDDHDDTTRPPGWYFDPNDATRMRYWHPRLGGWQAKTTRAPRSLRRGAGPAAPD